MSHNPGLLKMRNGWEASPGLLPALADFDKHFDVSTESLSVVPGAVDDNTITGDGQTPESLPGKLNLTGTTDHNVDAEKISTFLLNAQNAVDVTNPATGVYVHRLAPSGGTASPTSYAIEADRDDGHPMWWAGVRAQQAAFSLSPNGLLTCQMTHLAESAGIWPDAVETVAGATANDQLPRLRGFLTSAQRVAAAGEEVFVQVVSTAGLTGGGTGGTFTVYAKVGSAAFGSAFTSTVTVGNDTAGNPIWTGLVDSTTGARLGGDAQLEFTISDATGLDDADEWRFDRVRASWVSALPDVPRFNEIHASLTLDGGGTLDLDSLAFAIVQPVTVRPIVGGMFQKVRNRGRRAPTVTLAREYVDDEFFNRILAGEFFKVTLDCYSGTQFETGYEHRLKAVFPRLRNTGGTATVTSETEMVENLTCTAHPYAADPESYVDDVTVELTNSIVDLTA